MGFGKKQDISQQQNDSSNGSNSLALLQRSTKRNRDKTADDIKADERKRAKILKEAIDEEKVAKIKAEQRIQNKSNDKGAKKLTEKQLDDNHNNTKNIPQEWMVPPWVHDTSGRDDLDVMIVDVEHIEERYYNVPKQLRKEHEVPLRQDRMSNKKDQDSVAVPVMRLTCLAENGCTTQVRVHGWKPHFLIPLRANKAKEVIRDLFPEIKHHQDFRYHHGEKMPLSEPVVHPCDTMLWRQWNKTHREDDFKEFRDNLIKTKQANNEEIPKDYKIRQQWDKIAPYEYENWKAKTIQKQEDHQAEIWNKEREERNEKLLNHESLHEYCEWFKESLENQLQAKGANSSFKFKTGNFSRAMVLSVKPCCGRDMFGYDFDEQMIFLDITVAFHDVQKICRNILSQDGLYLANGDHLLYQQTEFYNYTLSPEMLLLIEHKMAGQTWITLPGGTYDIKTGPILEEIRQGISRRATDGSFGKDDNSMTDEDPEVARMMEEFDQDSEEQAKDNTQHSGRKTWCHAEVEIHLNDIVSRYQSSDPKWDRIAGWRRAAIDIECSSKTGHFPKAERDPIICISVDLIDKGTGDRRAVVLTTKKKWKRKSDDEKDPNDLSLEASNAEVWVLDNERQLLKCFADLCRAMQVIEITGFNMNKFDWPYLLDRAAFLGLDTFKVLSPYKEATKTIRSIYQSAAMGTEVRVEVVIPGTLTFDLYGWAKREKKLSSNTLNFVAEMITGNTKADLPHQLITPLFNGTQEERNRLMWYNYVDSRLCNDIAEDRKEQLLVRNTEIARVTGTTIQMLTYKGQGVRTESQLHRLMRNEGFFAPDQAKSQVIKFKKQDGVEQNGPSMTSSTSTKHTATETAIMDDDQDDMMAEIEEEGFQGANVVKPKVGLYKSADDPEVRNDPKQGPTATLDFASLYPSIMRAWNLSYDTFIRFPERDLPRLRPEDVAVVEVSDTKRLFFVKRHKRHGLLCRLVANLMNSRGAVKGAIKKATNEGMLSLVDLLEARSLALKLAANSTYGFAAAFKLHLKQISEAVCTVGRKALEWVIVYVHGEFTAKKYAVAKDGVPKLIADAVVIYGDTDSVMILFPGCTVKEVNVFAEMAEEGVNKHFQEENQYPMAVEFEKIYRVFNLYRKKAYCGLKYDPGFFPGSMIRDEKTGEMKPYKPKLDAKGIEMKRRDKIRFVRKIIEEILNRIMIQHEPWMDTLKFVHASIEKLCQGKLPISQIIQTKSIKADYNGMNQQLAILEKIRLRDPGNVPEAGDRVSFVYVQPPYEKAKAHEQVEEPMVAWQNCLPIDYKKIGDSLVKNALRRVLRNSIPYDGKYNHLQLQSAKEEAVKRGADKEVMKLLGEDIHALRLYISQHDQLEWVFEPFTKTYTSITRPPGGAISAFTKSVPTCLHCHQPIDDPSQVKKTDRLRGGFGGKKRAKPDSTESERSLPKRIKMEPSELEQQVDQVFCSDGRKKRIKPDSTESERSPPKRIKMEPSELEQQVDQVFASDPNDVHSGTIKGVRVLCDLHRGEYETLFLEYQMMYDNLKKESDSIWDTCRKCVGPSGNAKECANDDCAGEYFWTRREVDRELDECRTLLSNIQSTEW